MELAIIRDGEREFLLMWHGATWRQLDDSRPATADDKRRARDDRLERVLERKGRGARLADDDARQIAQYARLHGYQAAADRFGIAVSTAWVAVRRLEGWTPAALKARRAEWRATRPPRGEGSKIAGSKTL